MSDKDIKAKVWRNGRGLCINLPKDVHYMLDLDERDYISFVQVENGYIIKKMKNNVCSE